MLRDMKTLKDVLLASAILLVIVASRAEGQARATLLTRTVPPDAEGAIMALEESREALLEAREAIDAALRRVDETLASLGESPSRGRSIARTRNSVPARAPTMDDLRAGWKGFLAFCSRLENQLSPWGESIARVSSGPVPGAKASPDAPVPFESATPAFARESEAAPITPALEAAAVAGPQSGAVESTLSGGTPSADPGLPDRILGAAGAFLRALDDVAARGVRQPEPEDRDPLEKRPDALPADPSSRDGARTDRGR
jgi:hypothetical protein